MWTKYTGILYCTFSTCTHVHSFIVHLYIINLNLFHMKQFQMLSDCFSRADESEHVRIRVTRDRVKIFLMFSPKNFAKKLAFLTQNKVKLCKILIITLEKNDKNFFAENCRKSQKIVIITSTPDCLLWTFPHLENYKRLPDELLLLPW
jgi:hypothetical protein